MDNIKTNNFIKNPLFSSTRNAAKKYEYNNTTLPIKENIKKIKSFLYLAIMYCA